MLLELSNSLLWLALLCIVATRSARNYSALHLALDLLSQLARIAIATLDRVDALTGEEGGRSPSIISMARWVLIIADV